MPRGRPPKRKPASDSEVSEPEPDSEDEYKAKAKKKQKRVSELDKLMGTTGPDGGRARGTNTSMAGAADAAAAPSASTGRASAAKAKAVMESAVAAGAYDGSPSKGVSAAANGPASTGGLKLPPGWSYKPRKAPPGEEGVEQPYVWRDPKWHQFDTFEKAQRAIEKYWARMEEQGQLRDGDGGGASSSSAPAEGGGRRARAAGQAAAARARSMAYAEAGANERSPNGPNHAGVDPRSGYVPTMGAGYGRGRKKKETYTKEECCTFCPDVLPLDPVDRAMRRATLITIADNKPICKKCASVIIEGLKEASDLTSAEPSLDAALHCLGLMEALEPIPIPSILQDRIERGWDTAQPDQAPSEGITAAVFEALTMKGGAKDAPSTVANGSKHTSQPLSDRQRQAFTIRPRVEKAERKTEMEVRKALAGIINEIPGAGPDPNAPQPKLEVTLPINILPGQRLMVPFNGQKFSFIVPAGAIPGQKMLVAVPAGIKMPPPLTAEQMAEQRAKRAAQEAAQRAEMQRLKEERRKEMEAKKERDEIHGCLNRIITHMERQHEYQIQMQRQAILRRQQEIQRQQQELLRRQQMEERMRQQQIQAELRRRQQEQLALQKAREKEERRVATEVNGVMLRLIKGVEKEVEREEKYAMKQQAMWEKQQQKHQVQQLREMQMQHRMMAQQQKQQEHAARQQQMLQQAKQQMLNRGLSGMRDGRALPNYASMNSSGYGGFYDQGVLGYSDGNGAGGSNDPKDPFEDWVNSQQYGGRDPMQVEELLRQGGGPPPPGFQMRRFNPGSGGGGGGGGGGKRQPRVRLKLKYPAGRYPSKRVIEKFGPFEMPGIDVGIGLGGGPSGDALSGEALVQCNAVMRELRKHKDAALFNDPVDWKALGLNDYPLIIKTPMDLGTVMNRLMSGQYSSVLDVAADVDLVWSNAMVYNIDGSDIYNTAADLKAFADRKFAPLVAAASEPPLGSPLAAVGSPSKHAAASLLQFGGSR